MKKDLIRIIVLILVTVAVGGASAQSLTEQEAKARALRYLNTHGKAFARGIEPSADLTLTAAKVEAKRIFAFNCESGGYVIASADSRALPVLGYSDSGTIDWEQMPENMRVWLRLYDEAIASLGDRTDFKDGDGVRSKAYTRTPHAAIEPLIRSNWYQIVPYYNHCPLYEGPDTTQTGKRCLTGCVATSMAQVMHYFQWPKSMPEGLPGYDIVTELEEGKQHVWHVDSLPPVTFEWADMLDCYLEPRDGSLNPKEILGTEAQQQAVATLMRYCGQAVKMTYGVEASAAPTYDQYEALTKCFGYNAATLLSLRLFYGIDEWEDIIYGELAASRPVLYYGYSEGEGHSFICDGYDGDGLFHINWGWGGKDDGFFSLSVLNPYNNTSAGSGSSGIGFNINQGAIIYLDPMMEPQPSPEEGKPELIQYAPLSLEDDHTVRFQFAYRMDDAGTVTVDHALGTCDDNGVLEPRFIGDPNDSIVYDANYMLVEIDSTVFEPGDSLRLYPMLRFRHADNPEWQMIPPADYCVDAGRTDEGTFFIRPVSHSGAYLECVGGAITKGTGAKGARSDVTVTVSNHDEKDFVGELGLVPYYGEQEGDVMWCGAYLRAGQEGEVTFSFKPRHSGSINLVLTNVSGLPLGSFTIDISEPTDIQTIEKDETKGQVLDPRLSRRHQAICPLDILLPKGIYIKDGKKYMW